MTSVYVFMLKEDKFYISEFNNDIIEPIERMIKKIVPENDSKKIQSLLTDYLGSTISSLEWIKKYPIEYVTKSKIKLEKITIQYMETYGIDNVRSNIFKDIKLSEDIIESIEDSIKTFKIKKKESSETISMRIKKIDFEIYNLKKVYDTITINNKTINKYENYGLGNIINYYNGKDKTQEKYKIILDKLCRLNQEQVQQLRQQQQQQQIQQHLQRINQKVTQPPNFHPKGENKSINIETQIRSTVNLLLPNFTEIYEEIYGNYKEYFSDYFSDHKIVEEIASASLLKKKNEKLIFKYGTLQKINEALSKMLYEKIDLINSMEMDDIPDDIEIGENDFEVEDCDNEEL